MHALYRCIHDKDLYIFQFFKSFVEVKTHLLHKTHIFLAVLETSIPHQDIEVSRKWELYALILPPDGRFSPFFVPPELKYICL